MSDNGFAPTLHVEPGSLMALAKQSRSVLHRQDDAHCCRDFWRVGSTYARAQSLVENSDKAAAADMQRMLEHGSPAETEAVVRSLLKFIVPLAKSAETTFVAQSAINCCSAVTFEDVFEVMLGSFAEIAETGHGFYVISAVLGRANLVQRAAVMREVRDTRGAWGL